MSEEKKIIPEGQLTDEALDAATGGEGTRAGYAFSIAFYECTNPNCGRKVAESVLRIRNWSCPHCEAHVDISSAKRTIASYSGFFPDGLQQS